MSHTFTVCPHCDSLNKLKSTEALSKTPVCGKCGKNIELHGLVSEVTTKNFERIIRKSDVPVVVDFWATWCGPCKTYGPEFEKASTETQNAVFLKINTETEQNLSAQMGIRGIPCTVMFLNGKEVKRQAGAMSREQLKAWVDGR